MTQHVSNTSEADEIDLVAGYGTAVAVTRPRPSTIRSHHATPPGDYFSGKETVMTQYSSNAYELDEIDFTTGYGTAVAMPRTRRSAVRSDHAEVLAGPSRDDDTSSLDSSQADASALMLAAAPARRSKRLAAVPGTGKGLRRKPQPSGGTNRRRKAA